MRKLLFIFIALFLFFGCEQAIELIPEIEDEPETIEETIIEEIIVDVIPEIIPDPVYTNVFKISGTMGNITTPIELSESILTFDETDYNIEEMTPDVNGLPVKTTYTNTDRIISMQIEIDSFSSFYFINNNMIDIKNIDPDNMSTDEFQEVLSFIYPPPEPVIPEYSETKYHLSGHSEAVSDSLSVSVNSITIGGIVNYWDDMNIVYIDDVRKFMIDMSYDSYDSFLFINNNMYEFFGIDFTDMSYEELIIAADILNRYPEEGIRDLWKDYPQ